MRKGFSTIELLTTMSVIGILGTTMLPSFTALQNEAKITKAQAEVKTLQSMVERYQVEKGSLPRSLDTLSLDENLNIVNQNIIDPFTNTTYKIDQGITASGKKYYVIYSPGIARQLKYVIEGNKLIVDDQAIVVSNLFVEKK